MSGARLPMRHAVTVVVLVIAWCALWGEVNVANVASGLLLAVGLLAAGVGTAGRGGLRPGPAARFAVLVARDLVVSTVNVAREILTKTDYTEEAIVAVDVPTNTRAHLLLLTVAVTVTPGTAVVDADPDRGILYLHLLHHDRNAQVKKHVQELADLACAALPIDEEPNL